MPFAIVFVHASSGSGGFNATLEAEHVILELGMCEASEEEVPHACGATCRSRVSSSQPRSDRDRGFIREKQ